MRTTNCRPIFDFSPTYFTKNYFRSIRFFLVKSLLNGTDLENMDEIGKKSHGWSSAILSRFHVQNLSMIG